MAKTLLQCADKPELCEIAKILDGFNYKWDRYTILCDIFEASAIAISNQTDVVHSEQWNIREQRYKDIMSKNTLGSYINGSVNPSAMAIIRLAKGLNVSADWLLCLSNEIKRAPEKPKNVKAPENPKPQVITKTVVASENMTQHELEMLVCSYTGLTRQAVRGLHNSRGFQIRWIRSE